MQYESFIGETQHRLGLGTRGEAVRATRATLTTLGERLEGGEATDLASPLPIEIDRYLTEADSGQQFSFNEFLDRVSERANVDEADAAFQAKAMMTLLAEVAPGSEMDDVRGQFPEEFSPLFELVGAEQRPWEARTEAGD